MKIFYTCKKLSTFCGGQIWMVILSFHAINGWSYWVRKWCLKISWSIYSREGLCQFWCFVQICNSTGIFWPKFSSINLCFIMFHIVKTKVWRKSLMALFQNIASYHLSSDSIHADHCRVFSNILINNYYTSKTPRSSKESKLKVIKLGEI